MNELPLLKTLEGALEELKAIPLWGSPPPFPWEELSDKLQKTLEIPHLELTLTKSESLEDPLSGMGKEPFIRPFTLSPLPAELFLVMPLNAQKELISLTLTKDPSSKGLTDKTLIEGYLQFLLLNAATTFNHLNTYGNMSVTLADDAPLPKTSLCIDFTLKASERSIPMRLIFSSEFIASFKSTFAMEKPPLLTDPSFSDMPLSLSLLSGNTTLSAHDFKNAAVGDFILLDRCTYIPEDNKGSAILTLGNTPLFDVRIKGGEAKILEYAMIQEEKPMTDEISKSEEDSNLPKENLPDETEGSDDPLWSPPEAGSAKPLPADNIPLNLTVEIGRFQMPLSKVTQLRPGNVLDLDLGPNLSVHLTTNGKRIAKGELVRLGEALGIKILTLGD